MQRKRKKRESRQKQNILTDTLDEPRGVGGTQHHAEAWPGSMDGGGGEGSEDQGGLDPRRASSMSKTSSRSRFVIPRAREREQGRKGLGFLLLELLLPQAWRPGVRLGGVVQ